MSVATLNIKVYPRRMLNIREAASYCGVSAKRFPSVCMIAPVKLPGGDELYDMRDLDTWLDGLKIGGPNSDDEILARLG